jgi:acyl-ACP thioesterase
VQRFPRFGERFTVATFCSGLGRMWAERRTTIARVGAAGSHVEAVSLWVHLDPVARRPFPLSAEELDAYDDAAAGRRVNARLRHPAPGSADSSVPWRFRATECDLAGHINNAAYWQPLEEELLNEVEPERIDVEMEFRAPAQPGNKLVLRHGPHRWIVDSDGELHASLVVLAGT